MATEETSPRRAGKHLPLATQGRIWDRTAMRLVTREPLRGPIRRCFASRSAGLSGGSNRPVPATGWCARPHDCHAAVRRLAGPLTARVASLC